MVEQSAHLRLQQQIDCLLETNPKKALEAWEATGWNEEPGTDVDEAPLKLIALVLLDAVSERATRISLERDAGATIYSDSEYSIAGAPPHYFARGLEILREIVGIDKPEGQGRLSLGIRNDQLELILQKEKGLHIITIPGIGGVSG